MWYVLGSKHTLTLLYILWGQIQPLYYMVFSERSCCRTIRRFATLAPYNIQPHRISHDIDSSGCGYSSCRVHCCSNSAALTKRRETAQFYTENTMRKGQRDGYVQCIDKMPRYRSQALHAVRTQSLTSITRHFIYNMADKSKFSIYFTSDNGEGDATLAFGLFVC